MPGWPRAILTMISIHAPREGSDLAGVQSGHLPHLFLSTLPVRGATRATGDMYAIMGIFLSTLPARGATRPRWPCLKTSTISIHAPREGSDQRHPAL